MALASGTRLGPYEMLMPIAQGGMGDVGQQDGFDYLVMEYVEGETLAAYAPSCRFGP